MKLLVAEKPSVARDHYKRMLERQHGEKFIHREGYLQGKDHMITWAVGHLVTLSPFDSYPGYEGSWRLANLPLIPELFKLRTIEATEKQFHIVQALMTQSHEIINGADAGREGNLIFDLLIDINPELKSKQFKRLWVNSYVEADLDQAWAKLEDISKRSHLSDAARLRQRADWLIGLNATRAYTLTAGEGKLFSVGRVQTPTLHLICQRDQEVETFKELYFYGLRGSWNEHTFKWIRDEKVYWSEHQEQVSHLQKEWQGMNAFLREWKVNHKKSYPPKPFDLTDLQKEANKKLKFKAARTLEIAQALYEKKLITYPRTDSSYLPASMKDQAFQLAQRLCPADAIELMREAHENFMFINSSKVTDHFAILPTGNSSPSLNPEEAKLYQLIRRRFVQAWWKPQKWQEATATIQMDQSTEKFQCKLKVLIDTGWKTKSTPPLNSDEEDSKTDSVWVPTIPDWQTGLSGWLTPLEVAVKKKPKPKYYTEATLLTAMKTAGKQLENEELAEAMKERGLGTPATQAGIIETLKQRDFVQEEKNSLVSTSKGRKLIEKVDELLKSPELTGEWEYKLKQIEKGTYSAQAFMNETKEYLSAIFNQLQTNFMEDFQREKIDWTSLGKCLICQGDLEAINWGIKCASANCEFQIPFKIAGRTFSQSEIQTLLRGQELGQLGGFKSKRNFDFKAKLRWNDKNHLEFHFKDSKSKSFETTNIKCPACQSSLEQNESLYRCSSERCEFKLWNQIARRPLSRAEARKLIKHKCLKNLDGFLSKKGSEFGANLILNSEFQVEFNFDKLELEPIKCPLCSSTLSDKDHSYSCHCGWSNHKIMGNRLLLRSELREILDQGKSKRLKDFQGRNGVPFSCLLYLDQTKKIQFDLGSIKKQSH